MKKESIVVKEKRLYELLALIKNTAAMKSADGTIGLVNVKKNKVVGTFDHSNLQYDEDNQFFIQEKTVLEENGDSLKKEKRVKIYDACKEQTIVDDWLVIDQFIRGDSYRLAILQNPATEKYHLFDKFGYRKSFNPFPIECDKIEFLYDKYPVNCKYFALTKDGKVGRYCTTTGIDMPIKYDNIEQIGALTIYTEGKYQFFHSFGSTVDKMKEDILFDEITVDEKDNDIFYCKIDSMTYIYYLHNTYGCRMLFTAPRYDDIKLIGTPTLGDFETEYEFLVKKDSKYGLICGVDHIFAKEPTACKELVPVVYDEIVYHDLDYFLTKNNRLGLFRGTSNQNNTLSCEYDNIIPLIDRNYELFRGERCDIINLDTSEPIITDCKIVKNVSYWKVIFEKDGTGILSLSHDVCKVFEHYDKIEDLEGVFFKTKRDGKEGLIVDSTEFIEPSYKNISLQGDNPNDSLYDSNTVFLALQKEDGTYDLAKLAKTKRYGDWYDAKLELIGSYDDVKLYPDIMILRDQKHVHIVDYQEKLLKDFPKDVEIVSSITNSKKEPGSLYCVNGVYYFHENQKFEKKLMEECDLYVTTYESDYGTVVVNSYDELKHDETCRKIEEGGEELFDKVLVALYDKHPKIQEKYPKLVKKLK